MRRDRFLGAAPQKELILFSWNEFVLREHLLVSKSDPYNPPLASCLAKPVSLRHMPSLILQVVWITTEVITRNQMDEAS